MELFLEKRKELIKRMDQDESGQSVINWYDKEANVWHQNFVDSDYRYHVEIAKALSDVVQSKDAFILDVGAGTGYLAAEVTKQGFPVIDGVDGSTEMLKIAKGLNIYRHLYHAYVKETKITAIDDGSYDGVVCGAAISRGHLSYKTIPTLLRTLKIGGHLVFTVSTCNFEFDGFSKNDLLSIFQTLENKQLAQSVMEKYTEHRTGEPAVLFVLKKTCIDWPDCINRPTDSDVKSQNV